jgi:hypothetical protein
MGTVDRTLSEGLLKPYRTNLPLLFRAHRQWDRHDRHPILEEESFP